MNNKFTKSGMAHLNPFRKKKKEKPEVKQVPYRRAEDELQQYLQQKELERVTRMRMHHDFASARAREAVGIRHGAQVWPDMGIRNSGEPGIVLGADLQEGVGIREQVTNVQRYEHITMADMSAMFSNATTFKSAASLEKTEPKPAHIKITKNPQGYQHTRGFVGNHQHVEYKYDKGDEPQKSNRHYGQISISDSIGGCGMQQLYGWTGVGCEEVGDMLIDTLLKDIHYHTGVILCQVGMHYYENPMVKSLEKAGFTVSFEYINYTHGLNGKYTQRVYQYIVPDKSEHEEEDREYDEDDE